VSNSADASSDVSKAEVGSQSRATGCPIEALDIARTASEKMHKTDFGSDGTLS
jgi:hypothetical protein